jgi:hypothetical protein
MRERVFWISAGLLGLLLAAALAGATSRVTRPDVGLAGEPVSAGEALAPPVRTVTVPAAPVARARPVKHAKKRVTKHRAHVVKATAPRANTALRVTAAPAPATVARSPLTTSRPKVTAKITPSPRAKVKRPLAPIPALTVPTPTVETENHVSGNDGGGDSGSGKGKGGGGDD